VPSHRGVPGISLFAALNAGEGLAANAVGAATATDLPSDAQIIALAHEDTALALDVIYKAYRGRIYSFLLRFLGDPELAADITQDAFTKTYRSLGSLTREHKVLPWLYRIASNTAIDHVRRRKRFAWVRLTSVADTRDEPDVAGPAEGVGERQQVQAVLRTLPPENAMALLLHAVEGYSYKEIAEIQRCTMTAVRSRIARAREAFRREYATKQQP
jgi:RNA polymerase sigma-70 factor (ECF subfamily)